MWNCIYMRVKKIRLVTAFVQSLKNEYDYVNLLFSCTQFCYFHSVVFQVTNVIVSFFGDWSVPIDLFLNGSQFKILLYAFKLAQLTSFESKNSFE